MSAELIQEMINYIMTKPYKEVYDLMQKIRIEIEDNKKAIESSSVKEVLENGE